MYGNNWTAQAHGGEGAAAVGAAAGVMDFVDWRTQLLPESRRRIVDKIIETLGRHLPVYGQQGVQELNRIAVSFEERIYIAATSQQDYLRKISIKMLTMQRKCQNPMTPIEPNAASSGQKFHGPGVGATPAAATVRPMDTADWRTQLLPSSRQRIVNRITETLMRHLPFYGGQEGLQELKKIAMRFEERTYDAATSQQDYLWKISVKMFSLDQKSQNPVTNSIQPNAASSGQNDHDPEEVSEEATEEETTDEEDETIDEQATEEDDGDESAESEVTEEQNSAARLKENVEVGENEFCCGLSSGAELDDCSAQVEERLKKMEADVGEVKTLLAGIVKKLNYLVKIQYVKVAKDSRRPANCMRSSWTSNGQPKRKHRIADLIRRSCKHRRLGRGAVEGVSSVALHDECAKDDQRRPDEEQKIDDN